MQREDREPSGGVKFTGWRGSGMDRSAVGIALALSIVLGLASGYYLDRWFGTAPWLTMIGFALGIVAGFVNLFRSTK